VKLLLDTHALLWMSLDDSQLSDKARELIADLENELWLSPASYWEIAIKISLGKYELSEPLDQFVNREVSNNDISILPISTQHAQAVTTLPFHHKDPFDRLLIAQALTEGMTILSKDNQFDDYGVPRMW
jgi:PIN domain nuclease of toxin-antitoxin system